MRFSLHIPIWARPADSGDLVAIRLSLSATTKKQAPHPIWPSDGSIASIERVVGPRKNWRAARLRDVLCGETRSSLDRDAQIRDILYAYQQIEPLEVSAEVSCWKSIKPRWSTRKLPIL